MIIPKSTNYVSHVVQPMQSVSRTQSLSHLSKSHESKSNESNIKLSDLYDHIEKQIDINDTNTDFDDDITDYFH